MFKRLIASLVCVTLIFSNVQYVHAQNFSINQLPVPGTMIGESQSFAPLALKGLVINPQKPLEFQFIVDTGKGPQDSASIKEEANKLVKYFLAGLTIPEGELWVNLSPYEKNRITTQSLGQTTLGRDLLAQDYILKQLTASLIYPEKDLGKEFWSRVYARAQQQFGTTNIPVNTFNKVWILPDQAQVFENGPAAYVTKSTLKVILDEDYTALQENSVIASGTKQSHTIASQIVRQIILPEIEKEVNTGKNFAPLRQIYDAMILAKWYKETIQNGLLDAIYTNKKKIDGVNLTDPTVKEQIYQRYLRAYKKGVFNYIKEDPMPDGQLVPRKYFSGGISKLQPNHVDTTGSAAMISIRGLLLALTISLSALMPSRSLYAQQQGNIAQAVSKINLAPHDQRMQQRTGQDFAMKSDENIHFDLNDMTHEQVDRIVRDRVLGTTIQPELVSEDQLAVPDDYKRMKRLESKLIFRENMLGQLKSKWETLYDIKKANELTRQFEDLSIQLDDNGAVVFGDLIDRARFADLVTALDHLMESKGSKSLLHSYLNLRNHPDFLINRNFNGAFIHPLLIALMSYKIGGPVRIVDVRSKDTSPITARAQDNMLHIDNTPFNNEFKILVNWEKGKASGPKGQNFVFIPGTHKGHRQSFKGSNGHAWSSENGSIFITNSNVDQLFAFQRSIKGSNSVVEIQSDKPTSTLFEAGALVHHRYRTKEGSPRSCIIVAFQPAMDNPGEFIHGESHETGETDLEKLLFGYQDTNSASTFINAIVGSVGEITRKLEEIADPGSPAVTLKIEEKTMDPEQIAKWREIATDAPTIEELKKRDQRFPLGEISGTDLMKSLSRDLMFYDKHGPLDLILYYDSHEESRKWARNRIREMHLDDLQARLALWTSEIRNPSENDLLPPGQIEGITTKLLMRIDALTDEDKENGHLDTYERISSKNAYQSVRQLIDDLREAILRCDSLQNFLSTSLFIFWATDELYRLLGTDDVEIKHLGGILLRNYIATAIVERKRQNNAMSSPTPKTPDAAMLIPGTVNWYVNRLDNFYSNVRQGAMDAIDRKVTDPKKKVSILENALLIKEKDVRLWAMKEIDRMVTDPKKKTPILKKSLGIYDFDVVHWAEMEIDRLITDPEEKLPILENALKSGWTEGWAKNVIAKMVDPKIKLSILIKALETSLAVEWATKEIDMLVTNPHEKLLILKQSLRSQDSKVFEWALNEIDRLVANSQEKIAIFIPLLEKRGESQHEEYNLISNLLHKYGHPAGNKIYVEGKTTGGEIIGWEGGDRPILSPYSTEWVLVNRAMLHTQPKRIDKAVLAANGGIDLNQINVKRLGKTIKMQFDPAQLNQLTQGGFEGFTPVIINMTRISSPFQLLGVNQPAKEPELLAKA